MKKILITISIFSSLLSGSDSAIIRKYESALYSSNYKKIVHLMYEIKKQQQELLSIHNKIQKVQKDISLKELRVTYALEEISGIPLVEVSLLKQNSIGLQVEQSVNEYQIRDKQLEQNDANLILEK